MLYPMVSPKKKLVEGLQGTFFISSTQVRGRPKERDENTDLLKEVLSAYSLQFKFKERLIIREPQVGKSGLELLCGSRHGPQTEWGYDYHDQGSGLDLPQSASLQDFSDKQGEPAYQRFLKDRYLPSGGHCFTWPQGRSL